MRKFQIQKGLFRLWIVLTVLWVCFVGYVAFEEVYRPYKYKRDEIISAWDYRIDNLRDVKEFAQEWKGDAPKTYDELFDYTIGNKTINLRSSTREELIEAKNYELNEEKNEFLNRIPKLLLLMVGVPVLFLVGYFILRWIIKGFVKQ